MNKHKPAVTEKHHLSERDESFSITIFGKVWTIKILMPGSTSTVFQSNPLLQSRSFNLEFDR